jgi:hypothetical protein
MNAPFSWLTIILLALGWLTHWLQAVKKARLVAEAAGKEKPSLMSYWTADPYSLAISIIGLFVGYFVIPHIARGWPELAALIGSTDTQPMNPLAAYLGGFFMPSIADAAGKRLQGMIGP